MTVYLLFVCRDAYVTLQAKEGIALKNDKSKYYTDLCDKLDLILVFTEHGTVI